MPKKVNKTNWEKDKQHDYWDYVLALFAITNLPLPAIHEYLQKLLGMPYNYNHDAKR